MSSIKRKRDDLSDSEDEEEQVPGRQILPVANLPANFDGEPVDGLQYLFTVRHVRPINLKVNCIDRQSSGVMHGNFPMSPEPKILMPNLCVHRVHRLQEITHYYPM